MRHLGGEHTFWPWTKKNPSLKEVERTLAKEMMRYPKPPRVRIVRWCRNRITKEEVKRIQILNDI